MLSYRLLLRSQLSWSFWFSGDVREVEEEVDAVDVSEDEDDPGDDDMPSTTLTTLVVVIWIDADEKFYGLSWTNI